jgi:hypothetical protein
MQRFHLRHQAYLLGIEPKWSKPMAIKTVADLKKELHKSGIKTYKNTRTKASYVKRSDLKQVEKALADLPPIYKKDVLKQIEDEKDKPTDLNERLLFEALKRNWKIFRQKFTLEKGYGQEHDPEWEADYLVLVSESPIRFKDYQDIPKKIEKDVEEGDDSEGGDYLVYKLGIDKDLKYVFIDIEVAGAGETEWEIGAPDDPLDTTTYEYIKKDSDIIKSVNNAFTKLFRKID